jgi:hypothetical protein
MRPCRITRSISRGSTLPPERTPTTGASNACGFSITAATAATPAGSTTSFARSSSISSARDNASSETVTTSSTSASTWRNVISPGMPTAMPSAIVAMVSSGTGCRATSDAGNAAAFSACTATTRTSGFNAFTATAMPETRPPPPVQTTIVFASGTWSRISSPAVPCPAMTCGWSNGWMNTLPRSAASALAATSASSTVTPLRMTSAPYALVASTFGNGAPCGIYTRALAPSMLAARATPCAWLPALAATTPFARSASVSRAMRT